MDPYRHAPGWSVFVDACPELALPEDSDDEDWRASLAKVKAQPAVTVEVPIAGPIRGAATPSPVTSAPPVTTATPADVAGSSADAPKVPAVAVPVNTARSGPVPRPADAPPAEHVPSAPPVATLEPRRVSPLPTAPENAESVLNSDGSGDEDEDEEEAAGDDSDEDEIDEDAHALDALAAEDVVEVAPRRRKAARTARGSRQDAKDFPSEIRPEDVSLGAYRAGPDLVVRSFPFYSCFAGTDCFPLSVYCLSWCRNGPRGLYSLPPPATCLQTLLRQQGQVQCARGVGRRRYRQGGRGWCQGQGETQVERQG